MPPFYVRLHGYMFWTMLTVVRNRWSHFRRDPISVCKHFIRDRGRLPCRIERWLRRHVVGG